MPTVTKPTTLKSIRKPLCFFVKINGRVKVLVQPQMVDRD